MAQQARGSPAMVCNKVLHVRDRECWREASHQTQKRSAPGLDHVTAPQYAERLDENLQERQERLRDHWSVAPPVERVWIAKATGKQRPRGEACFEAKRVQRAVVMILAAICEQDGQAFSQGFRTGHRPQQALHERREPCRTWHSNWRVDAAVRGGCDHVAWSPLRECRQQRGSDGGRRRLLGTWRHAGVREAGALRPPDKGPPPGGGIAPRLAKVVLPQVLEEWGVKDVLPRRPGHCLLRRCADDCLIGCARDADARRRLDVLPKRCTRFRRTMHPENTVLMACKRPPSRNRSAGGTGTCALRGLPHSWATTRQGYGAASARRSGNACGGVGKSAGHGVVSTAMPLSKRRPGRAVQHCGATPNTMVDVATARGSKWFASLSSVRGTPGSARAATQATYTGRSLRGAYVRRCRCRNPASSTTSSRARVSTGRRQTGCRLFGEPLAHAGGSRGTGCVHCARPGLWGGRRVTGAFTRKATA